MDQQDINEMENYNHKVVFTYNWKIYKDNICVINRYMQLSILSNM